MSSSTGKRGTELGGRVVKTNEAQEKFKGRQARSCKKCVKSGTFVSNTVGRDEVKKKIKKDV